MKPKVAIYLAAGLTLCAAAISVLNGIIGKVAYDHGVAQGQPDAIIDLRSPDDSYWRIGTASLLIATQLIVIVYARKLNSGKQSAQPA